MSEIKMEKLAKLFLPEDSCFRYAAAQYQSILDNANGDLNVIIEKYIYYKNMFMKEQWELHGGSNNKLDFLRELCDFLEGRIVWMTLENSGYKINVADGLACWKKV